MDLSKLPRMSKTPAPPPEQTPADAPIAGSSPSPASASGVCAYCSAKLRPGAKFCYSCGSPVRSAADPAGGMLAEAWISVAIGILLLVVFPTMIKYVSHLAFHTAFAPYSDADGKPSDSALMTDGTIIPYLKTTPLNAPNFWSDVAVTLFALALIAEGVALVLSRRPIVVMFALAITVGATVVNFAFVAYAYGKYGSLQQVSALALIFGLYMAIYQYQLFRVVSSRKSGQF